mmetsp:Transcript_8670/g.6427  ORF Transcript_8670/g.6427 Transcript_8670/m.6427 type:complete len:187 (+) Transcript_8670:143-703(+)
MYDFRGQVVTEMFRSGDGQESSTRAGAEEHFDLDIRNFLYRSSVLKNSGLVHAIVIYPGMDSKIYKNMGKYRHKISTMEWRVNYIMLFEVATMFFFSMVMSVKAFYWTKNTAIIHKYIFPIFPEDLPHTIAGRNFLIFYLVLGFLLPIAIFINLEIAKIAYTKLVEYDVELAHVDPNINDIRTVSL